MRAGKDSILDASTLRVFSNPALHVLLDVYPRSQQDVTTSSSLLSFFISAGAAGPAFPVVTFRDPGTGLSMGKLYPDLPSPLAAAGQWPGLSKLDGRTRSLLRTRWRRTESLTADAGKISGVYAQGPRM